MKLDLNFILKGLNGEPISGQFDNVHAGAIVANALAYNSVKLDNLPSSIKRFTLAQELYKQMPIEVDSSEAKDIKILISQANGFPPITVSQIHEVIDKLLES